MAFVVDKPGQGEPNDARDAEAQFLRKPDDGRILGRIQANRKGMNLSHIWYCTAGLWWQSGAVRLQTEPNGALNDDKKMTKTLLTGSNVPA
jgi:hypothetical protein